MKVRCGRYNNGKMYFGPPFRGNSEFPGGIFLEFSKMNRLELCTSPRFYDFSRFQNRVEYVSDNRANFSALSKAPPLYDLPQLKINYCVDLLSHYSTRGEVNQFCYYSF